MSAIKASDAPTQSRAKTSGAKTSRAATPGAKTSGAKTSGAKTSSAKTSGAKTSGAKTSNEKTFTPKTWQRSASYVLAVASAFIGRAWRTAKSRALAIPYAVPVLKWTAIVAVCLYVAAAAVLYVMQRSLMYFPDTVHTTPAQVGLPDAQEVALTASDGVRITAWYVTPQDNKPVIVYFHGNDGSLRNRAGRFKQLAGAGIGLVALEYRGFGGNAGNPSEDGLIADGEAAYAFAAAHYPITQIVLWGESLGTGVAVAVAAQQPVGRVILEAPFTSAAAVASIHYWYMPVRLLMKDQFHSDQRIGKVTASLLILHGVHDTVVPYAMGERMFELANKPKHIVRFLDGGHEDLDTNGALNAVAHFLAGDWD
jgi:uncharacterized protein